MAIVAEKDWTIQQAIEANERALEKDPTLPSRVQPLFVWAALRDLAHYEQLFLSGDNFALLIAVRICAQHEMPLPDWAARAFIKKFDTVLNLRAGSWDEAFGRPYPKGFHLNRARRRRELQPRIYVHIQEILAMDPKTPIGEGLFEQVGKEFGIGKTLASELYYSMVKDLSMARPVPQIS